MTYLLCRDFLIDNGVESAVAREVGLVAVILVGRGCCAVGCPSLKYVSVKVPT